MAVPVEICGHGLSRKQGVRPTLEVWGCFSEEAAWAVRINWFLDRRGKSLSKEGGWGERPWGRTWFLNFLSFFLFACAGFLFLLSLVTEKGATLQMRCSGFSLRWPLWLQSRGSRVLVFSSCGSWALSTGSVVVVCGLSCSTECGIFPDQGLISCLWPWQEDPLPLSPPGKPQNLF